MKGDKMKVTKHRAKYRATKTKYGWIYRGYFIRHADNREYGGDDGWNIHDDNPNSVACHDRFRTLKECKSAIDYWLHRNLP